MLLNETATLKRGPNCNIYIQRRILPVSFSSIANPYVPAVACIFRACDMSGTD